MCAVGTSFGIGGSFLGSEPFRDFDLSAKMIELDAKQGAQGSYTGILVNNATIIPESHGKHLSSVTENI